MNTNNSGRHLLKKCFKNALIVLTILFICGVLAFALTAVLWHLLEDPSSAPSSIPQPTRLQLEHFLGNSANSKKLPPAASCGKRIIGYYTEWESPEITEKQLRKLTHVIFLFAAIYEDGSARFWDEHGENRLLKLKRLAKKVDTGLKVMIGVGGYMVSPRFGPIVSDSVKRKRLVDDIISIVADNNLDGVEIFWIYPSQANRRNYLKMIKELREKLSQLEKIINRFEPFILSIVAPKFTAQLKNGYDMEKLLEHVDFLDVLTYDYFNYPSEEKKAGPNSPLYGGQGRSVDDTMKYLVCKTREPSRINMAISFYGTWWRNVTEPLDDNSDELWRNAGSGNIAVRWRELERDRGEREKLERENQICKEQETWRICNMGN